MSSVLDGLLVLSIEQAVAAPYCTSRLADAGARVIKVERAEGDFARGYDRAVGGLSSYFVWLNRGKQSLVADLKEAADAALLHAILDRADVFVQNLAPGAAARAGFASETLRAAHPALITVDISGYGDGAGSDLKAYDLLVQAESGLASITGVPEGPGRVGVSVCDIACGMSAHAAVLEALIDRGRTGRGKGIRLSLFDSVADWMSVPLLQFEHAGVAPARLGLAHPSICPYGAYRTGDDRQVVIAIQNEREWAQFCTTFLEEPGLAASAGFDSNVARVHGRAAVESRVAAAFAKLTRDAAAAKLRAANTAFGFVNDLEAFALHPALRRVTVATPGGPARVAAPPALTTDGPASCGPVPSIGEHSALIRTEFSARGQRSVGMR